MTSSLEDLSGSPDIKDYKLKFNKVYRSVSLREVLIIATNSSSFYSGEFGRRRDRLSEDGD